MQTNTDLMGSGNMRPREQMSILFCSALLYPAGYPPFKVPQLAAQTGSNSFDQHTVLDSQPQILQPFRHLEVEALHFFQIL